MKSERHHRDHAKKMRDDARAQQVRISRVASCNCRFTSARRHVTRFPLDEVRRTRAPALMMRASCRIAALSRLPSERARSAREAVASRCVLMASIAQHASAPSPQPRLPLRDGSIASSTGSIAV